MELKPFTPDDQYFDNLVTKFEKEYISLDHSDILTIKRCKDILVYDAVKDSSFVGNADEFVDAFLTEISKQLEGQNADHVLLCIVLDKKESVLMETISRLNDFMDVFNEDTEARWGLCHNEDDEPMRIVVAIGRYPQ